MKKLSLKYNKKTISKIFVNYIRKYSPYWVSCFVLIFSSAFFLNVSFGKTSSNSVENNLQPMPSVSVDLSGKANISYEIDIPSGTHGVDPNLSIHYSSTGAPGLLGMGWNLSGIEWISRDAAYGVDFSANDKFASTMSGSLVQNGSFYYSKKESFIRYAVSGTAPYSNSDTWTATDKSGNVYTFSYVTSASNGAVPTVWALSNVSDIYGNGYGVTYVGKVITFTYQDRVITINLKDKSNIVPMYTKSSPYPDNTIADNIVITAGKNLKRTYTFGYTTDINGNEVLSSISKEEIINNETFTYTPISYTYSTSTKPTFTNGDEFSNPNTYAIGYTPLPDKSQCLQGGLYCQKAGIACPSAPPSVKLKCETQKQADQLQCNAYTLTWFIPCTGGIKSAMPLNTLLDIDRDGKQEIVHLNGSEKNNDIHLEVTKKNSTDNNFTRSVISNNFPGFQYKTFSTLGFGDVNGDGSPDFAYSDGNILQVAMFNKQTGKFNNPTPFNNVSVAYTKDNYLLDLPDTQWKGTVVDINGDGLADYVKLVDATHLGIYLSNGSVFSTMIPVDVGSVFRDQGDGPEVGQFMDMNLDGRPELVFITTGKVETRVFAKDFSSSAPVDYTISNTGTPMNRWFTDINSDGRVDLVVLNGNGTLTPNFFDGKIFTKGTDISVPAYSEYSTKATPYRKFFADVNGDGYVDYIRYASDNTIRVSYGNGKGFNGGDASEQAGTGWTQAAKSLWNLGDLDGNGTPDFISMKEMDANKIMEQQTQVISTTADTLDYRNDQAMKSYVTQLNINSHLSIPAVRNYIRTNLGMNKVPNLTPAAFLSAILVLMTVPDPPINMESKVQVYFQNTRPKENQISQIDGGFNRTVTVQYTDCKVYDGATGLLSNDLLGRLQYNCGVNIGSEAYPNYPNINIGQIVSNISTNIGGLYVNTDTYAYTDNRVWIGTSDQSAGLGFRTRTITSSLSGDTHLERYIQTSNRYAGMSDYNETTNTGVGYKQKTSVVYNPPSYPQGQEWISAQSTYKTAYRDGLPLITTSQSFIYDTCGNVTTSTTSGAGSVVTESDTYACDTNSWILNRPSTSTKDIDGTVVENTQYLYNGKTGITVTSMAGTVAAATSYITLDNYGNQQSVKDPLGRTTTYEYDSVVHNFVTKVTNPANFTVTKTYDTSLGLELTALDANGAVITKRYDNKGRLSEIIPPGADSYVERYTYTDYNSGSYFYSVSKSIVNPDGGETTASEYYDFLGRSVRKESPGIQGKFIVETTEYDAKGQVTKKSNPFIDTLETPVYTVYTYNPYEGYVTRVDHPDGGYTIPSYNGFNESTQTYASDATLIGSQDLIKNAKGQVLTRTVDGKSLNYQYDTAGRLTKILDPEGSATTTAYDNAGRKTSVTDVNSGTTAYTYDQVGNIVTQKDARNITTTFTYDNLNRPTSISYSNGEGNTVLTYDEGGQAKFANGRLTTVVDDAGKLELGYDIKGNRTYQKRHIDDLDIIFRREYDIQNRLASTIYPDGTKVYQKYATTGHFSGITMDTADGSSKGYTVGSYNGPVIENGVFKIIRETGNGVKMEIQYDPIKRRPVGLVTKLASGNIESATSYTYDQRDNITKLEDTIVSGRTQDFVYDAQNRLTKATGKYGTENYTYSDNGNLTQRGQFTLAYGDSNHKHAVTAVTSPSTGTFNYSYDEAGNMISRNGDTMSYNSQGKLKQIDTEGGDKLVYLYDSTGNRIKKTSKTSGVVVYNFDGLYEIAKTPGEGDKHTLYFKGLHGDLFSQMTRNDAQLITSNSSFFLCSNISISCKDYYSNTVKFYLSNYAIKMYSIISRVEYDIAVWILVVLSLYGFYLVYNKEGIVLTSEGIESKWFAKRTLSVTPLLTVAVLFTFTNCGIFGGGKKKGDAPWLLLASGINSNTASVDDTSTGSVSGASGSGSGGGSSSLVPVTGMYFLHPDHLGSITMITDGRGNVIAGGNNGGKSHISYKPYGEIHRTDSSGPDITRFKYTGQEEDKESALMYYKARYYDPMIGRFLQADSVVMPESTFGMNRYMYVEGNPVRFGDDSGHSKNSKLESQLSYFALAVYAYNNPGYAGGNPVVSVYASLILSDNLRKHTKKNSFDSFLIKSGGGGSKESPSPKHYSAKEALRDMDRGGIKDMRNTLKWASGGLQRAADTVNIITFGKNHNENTLSHKLANSDGGRAITRNKGCIKVVYDVVILALVIFNPEILPSVLTDASWTEYGGDLGTALWYGKEVAGAANDTRYCKVKSL